MTPRKSLSLGALNVPERYVLECARGLLDGDGDITNFVHAPTKKTYPNYRYERIVVGFNSASRTHLEWLRGRHLALSHRAGLAWLLARLEEEKRDAYDRLRRKVAKRQGSGRRG